MKSDSDIITLPGNGEVVYSFGQSMFEGTVLDRPNRFLVNVGTGKEEIGCHLHDPGRLRELIYPGNSVLCRPTRGVKTSHSVTAAYHEGEWVLTDTRIHSSVAARFLPEGTTPEVPVGNHRMDFKFQDTLIEVKGCTLLNGLTATFPDAPTKRGKEHLTILRDHVRSGGRSLIMILAFRKYAQCFVPNAETDPAFDQEFRKALEDGVEYFIPRFSFEDGSIVFRGQIGLCGSYS